MPSTTKRDRFRDTDVFEVDMPGMPAGNPVAAGQSVRAPEGGSGGPEVEEEAEDETVVRRRAVRSDYCPSQ